jgi:hypothetical protein
LARASSIRRGVAVEAVDARLGIGTPDRDARPSGAAREVGDPGARRLQAGVDVRHRRDPLAPEMLEEHDPVERRLRLAAVLPVRGPGHAAAASERVHERAQRGGHGDGGARKMRRERLRFGVGQRLGMAGRQGEAPVLDLEDAADGLLLEPLVRVARMDTGRLGQLVRRRRAAPGERAVEAQPIAEIDAVEVERRARRVEQALGERVAPLRLGLGQGACRSSCRKARPAGTTTP